MRSACGDHAAVWLAERSAAAPNTYSDSHGASPKGRRWVGTGYPTGPDTHSFPHSRPFKASGSSPKGCPVCGGSGGGAGAEVSSPVARGRGACERNARASQLVESPAWPCVLMDRSEDRSPFHVSPSVLATGCFRHALTSLLLLKGLLFSAPRQGKDRRPIQATGCPRHHLQRTLRARSDNALSLVAHAWLCVVTRVDACGSR